MALLLLGKDSNSVGRGSPTLWQDVDTGDPIVQGHILTDPTLVAKVGVIPPGGTVWRLPRRMFPFLPKD